MMFLIRRRCRTKNPTNSGPTPTPWTSLCLRKGGYMSALHAGTGCIGPRSWLRGSHHQKQTGLLPDLV